MTDESDATPNDNPRAMTRTAEVEAVVQQVQRSHRDRIRWGIGRHTAELALRPVRKLRRKLKHPSPKSRRRKRHKRLL